MSIHIKESRCHWCHLLCSAIKLWNMCVHMKDSTRAHAQKKHLASPTLCSAAGSWCFINSTINAKVPSRPLLYVDAGWHIYSICTALITPCGCNHLISVIHLVKRSTAGRLSTRTRKFLVDWIILGGVCLKSQLYFCVFMLLNRWEIIAIILFVVYSNSLKLTLIFRQCSDIKIKKQQAGAIIRNLWLLYVTVFKNEWRGWQTTVDEVKIIKCSKSRKCVFLYVSEESNQECHGCEHDMHT